MKIKNFINIVLSASVFIVTVVTLKGLSSNEILTMNNEVAMKAINYYMLVEEEPLLDTEESVLEENGEEVESIKDDFEIVPVDTTKIVDYSAMYTGKLTGYGADCAGCSGSLSCATREGTKFNLYTDGIYYNDTEYGQLRILAADLTAFSCGTVIYVDNGKLDPFYAIVLDTGSSMRNAWAKGIIWMDLAHSSESDSELHSATSSDTKFSVQRWGW